MLAPPGGQIWNYATVELPDAQIWNYATKNKTNKNGQHFWLGTKGPIGAAEGCSPPQELEKFTFSNI